MKTASDEKRDATLRTFRGIAKKLPVFFIALVSCVFLFDLDSYKRSYDAAQAESIIVDDEYIEKLGRQLLKPTSPLTDAATWEGGMTFIDGEWKYLPGYARPTGGAAEVLDSERPIRASLKEILEKTVKFRKFKNGEEMQDAIMEEIAAEKNEKIKNYTLVADGFVKELAAPQFDNAKGDALERRIEKLKALHKLDETFNHFTEEAVAKSQLVATHLKPERLDLKFVRGGGSPAGAGILYPAFEPLLDEKSGVYVIYQMLWLAFAGLLLFCLIFVVSLAFRLLVMPAGVAAVSEPGKELLKRVSEASAGAGARATLISLAALGTATAVAAGGLAINGKANRALAATVEAQADASSGAAGNKRSSKTMNRAPGKTPPTEPGVPAPTPDLNLIVGPLASLDKTLGGVQTAISEHQDGGVAQVNNELNTIHNILNSRLPAAGNTGGATNVNVPGLSAYTDSVNAFSTNVATLSQQIGTLAGNMQTCCKNSAALPAAVVTPDDVTQIKKSLGEMQEALKRLEEKLAQAPPQTPPGKPYRPGLLSRVLPPYGDDLYVVTPDSLKSIEYFMLGMDKDGRRDAKNTQTILDALRDSIGDPPKGKGQFLDDLARKIAPSDKRVGEEGLKPWRDIILRYARIR